MGGCLLHMYYGRSKPFRGHTFTWWYCHSYGNLATPSLGSLWIKKAFCGSPGTIRTGVKERPFAQLLADLDANWQLSFQEQLRSCVFRAKVCLFVSRKGNITWKALSALHSKGEEGQWQHLTFRRVWRGGVREIANYVTSTRING